MADLRYLSAGLEISGRVDGPEPTLRIIAALPSGATRRIPLSESEALAAASELLMGVRFLLKARERESSPSSSGVSDSTKRDVSHHE